jgi:hypothetical protein
MAMHSDQGEARYPINHEGIGRKEQNAYGNTIISNPEIIIVFWYFKAQSCAFVESVPGLKHTSHHRSVAEDKQTCCGQLSGTKDPLNGWAAIA